MRIALTIITAMLVLTLSADAHICNDVFQQAKDNLVVKVDVRDGQLRIKKKGTFRVYLMNTMDRDIVEIHLDVQSKYFTAVVTPSADWRGAPRLRTTKKGGSKVYYEVELTRKRKTKEGKYDINLLLYGKSKNRNQIFKNLDINEALANMDVPKKPRKLKVDGKIKSSEWKKALLCSNFHQYKKSGRYSKNFPADQDTRLRFCHDKDTLYCLVDFQKKSKSGGDIVKIYIATDGDSKPEEVEINLQENTVTFGGKSDGITWKLHKKGIKMEIALPLKLFKPRKCTNAKTLSVNISRTYKGVESYWRGNQATVKDPVVFANFVFGKAWK